MSVLLLRLSAPMQSWGSRSRFTERDTEREPTKSGVIGLICSSLGKPREERPEHQEKWPTLEQMATLKMGVRVDREGIILRDYHTAGGGKFPGVKNYGVAKASGTTADTVTSNRYYLADAVFLVCLEGEDHELLKRINHALDNPVWPIFLGRKAFVPAEPVHLANGLKRENALEQVLRSYKWLVSSQERGTRDQKSPDQLRLILECEPGEDGQARQDQPVSFALGQRFHGLRRVKEKWVNLSDLPKEERTCT